MLLRYSPTSPYVRKVTVAAEEIGLADRMAWERTNPWVPESDIDSQNPLGKIPTLVLESGETLYESDLICEYLDSLHAGEKLFPPEGERRWQALKLHALADGMLDSLVHRVVENNRRPAELFWADWDAYQQRKVDRGLDALEQSTDRLEERLTIGQIGVACALGFLDFRFPSVAWRETRPRLTAWYDAFAKRPSMHKTVPRQAA